MAIFWKHFLALGDVTFFFVSTQTTFIRQGDSIEDHQRRTALRNHTYQDLKNVAIGASSKKDEFCDLSAKINPTVVCVTTVI